MWDEFTYPFPIFSAYTVEVWEWMGNFHQLIHCKNSILFKRNIAVLEDPGYTYQVDNY